MNLSKQLASLAMPGIQLGVTDLATRSHFGGRPHLPASIPWPEKQGKRLGFLARISLAELQQIRRIDWLPDHGALLFFYDLVDQPWGFDPKDRGSFAVYHVPDLDEPLTMRGDASEENEISGRNIAFHAIETYPPADRPQVEALSLSDEQQDAYPDFLAGDDLPKHRISGFPLVVQNDSMELECQLASNGLYCGDESGYNDPRATELASGAQDWRLLLQIDSDDDLCVMWGDCGLLYFWVREQDAKAGRFDNCWVVLQCS